MKLTGGPDWMLRDLVGQGKKFELYVEVISNHGKILSKGMTYLVTFW